MDIKLTEQEIEEIRKEAESERRMYKHIDIWLNGDIDSVIKSLEVAKEDLYKIPGVDKESLDVSCVQIPDEWEDGITYDGLRIDYELLGIDEEYFEKAKKNALESKQRRYEEYKKLKGEFEDVR